LFATIRKYWQIQFALVKWFF